jgi:hypothetical protein
MQIIVAATYINKNRIKALLEAKIIKKGVVGIGSIRIIEKKAISSITEPLKINII